MKIVRTYLYITCNKKILFVENILTYCGARLGCWILPFYGPVSLGALFEAYETFI